MPGKLTWYVNRLKTMSAPELVYRAGQAAKKTYEKTFEKKFDAQPDQLGIPSMFDASAMQNAIAGFKAPTDIESYHFFGFTLDLTERIEWHLDISSGKRFPLSFSKDIDIRSDAYGSAKVVWEVNRLQFLLPILIEYRKTGDVAKLDRFISIMSDWQQSNPWMRGVNWYSNIEVNIRLINWYWCWLLLAEDESWASDPKYKMFREKVWLPLLYQHCYYSHSNPSYYSSANNHLISEYAGLYIANTLWKFAETENWVREAEAGLEKEIINQHSENGINKEEAAEYIQFITDFFLLARVAAGQNGSRFSAKYDEQLKRIGTYIANFLDVKGNFPRYGDEDDGRVIVPDNDTHSNNFTSILNSLAVIYDSGSYKRADVEWDIKSALLTSYCNGKKIWDALEPVQSGSGSVFYQNEGHFFFKRMYGSDREVYAHFDAAALGYLSIAAHGHADALSLQLNIDGFEFLSDPGTFTYHTHPEWRKYFVGTPAHNTVTIDQKNQAELTGPTMWSGHYNVRVVKVIRDEENETVIAEHDGYKAKQIVHRRTVEFNKASASFLIIDEIKSGSSKPFELLLPFHLHPDVKIESGKGNEYLLTHPKSTARLQIKIDQQLQTIIVYAKEGTPQGWYSPSFMMRRPASLISATLSATSNILIQTTLKITL